MTWLLSTSWVEVGLVKLKPRVDGVLGSGQKGSSLVETGLIRLVGMVLLGNGWPVTGSVIGVEKTPRFSSTVGITPVSDWKRRIRSPLYAKKNHIRSLPLKSFGMY